MMQGKSSIIQSLPFISLILALLFFIIVRVLSRLKKRARGDSGGKKLPDFQFEVKAEKEHPERVQLKRPAFIEKPEGVMKVGIKELTTNGAFVTCPRPLAIGESFPIRILLDDHDPQTFNAEVVWNNLNVIEEEIVTRGMKVRFLKLSANDRKTINEIIAIGCQAKS